MNKEIKVGIADMKITRREGVLITYALGSCIGISLYDPAIKLAALLHIMLPEAGNMSDMNVFKFADTGIQEMLRKMAAFGGVKRRYQCKIAGGAKMFDMKSAGGIGNIGERNIRSVEAIMRAEQIRILKKDVGLNYARTMLIDAEDGAVKIRTAGRSEIIL